MSDERWDACGTYGGYQQHKLMGDTPCEPCRKAVNAYVREYRKRRPGTVKSGTVTERARRRALSRLAAEYPEPFQRLYENELAKVRPEIEKLRQS